MKKNLFVALGLAATTLAGHAAVSLTNGDFENTTGTFPTGWSVLGTAGNVTSVSAGPNLIGGSSTASLVGNGGITQDFAATDADGLTSFQLNMSFRLDNIALAGAGAERIRLRDNGNSGDIITLRLNAAGVDRFATSFTQALAFTMTSDTTYFLRVIGTLGAGGNYTIGLSTDGVNYTTSAAIVGFHGGPTGVNFETLTLENVSGGGFFVDNISIVPEPSIALLSGLGMLGLLRRRR